MKIYKPSTATNQIINRREELKIKKHYKRRRGSDIKRKLIYEG